MADLAGDLANVGEIWFSGVFGDLYKWMNSLQRSILCQVKENRESGFFVCFCLFLFVYHMECLKLRGVRMFF